MHTRTALISTCLSALIVTLSPAPETDAASGPAARFISAHSSNFSRRSGRRIDRIVIHTIEGPESSAIHWFQTRAEGPAPRSAATRKAPRAMQSTKAATTSEKL